LHQKPGNWIASIAQFPREGRLQTLSFAHFVAGKIAETVVRGVFVRLAERRVIKNFSMNSSMVRPLSGLCARLFACGAASQSQ